MLSIKCSRPSITSQALQTSEIGKINEQIGSLRGFSWFCSKGPRKARLKPTGSMFKNNLRLCLSAKHFLDVSVWPIDRYRTHKCSQSMDIYGHRNHKINQMRVSEKVIQVMVATLRGIQTHPNLGYLGYLDPYSPLNHINTSLDHFSSCHLCMLVTIRASAIM